MTMKTLTAKHGLSAIATVTLATPATHHRVMHPTVETVATVAVANHPELQNTAVRGVLR